MFNFLSGSTSEITITGKISSDPVSSEIKGRDGKPLAKVDFRMSENLKRRKEDADQWQTYFVSAIGKDAEMIAKYCPKGRLVQVKGALRASPKLDKEGKPTVFLNVDAKSTLALPDAGGGDTKSAPKKQAAGGGGGGDDGFYDDDLPF